MAERNLKTLWAVFDRGDTLKTPELERLLQNAQEGLAYLEARGESMAVFKTRIDINQISSFLTERTRSSRHV